MQIETGIHKQFYSIGPGIKQSGRVADNHQQPSRKMKDEPAVTAVTVRIAPVVGTVVLSYSVSKGDVRCSSALN